VLHLLPHLAAVLPITVEEQEASLAGADCLNLSSAVVTALSAPAMAGCLQGGAHLADWAAATTAVLQLLPLLSQLHARWEGRRSMSDAERGAPARLSGALCTDVLFNGAVACIEWMGSDKAGQPQPLTLASQLFQLHSHTCRLLHAVLAGRCRLLLPANVSEQRWYMLLRQLNFEVSGAATTT